MTHQERIEFVATEIAKGEGIKKEKYSPDHWGLIFNRFKGYASTAVNFQAEAIILYAYDGNMQMYKDDTNGKKYIDAYLMEHGYIEPKN